MPMVVIDLLGANPILEGQVSRKLLEVRPGVYTGSLPKRQIELLWNAVAESKPQAALLVYPAKTETGITIKTVGSHRYEIVESDGLQLVRVKSNRVANPKALVSD